MCRRTPLRAALALAALALAASAGQAQPAPPSAAGRPAVSPYLNLLRQGSSPAVNYYGLVRPEFNTAQSFQNVQSAVSGNQRSINELYNGGGLIQTGIPSQYLNYRSYFLNQSGAGLGVGVGGVGGGGTRSVAGGTAARR